MLTKPRDPAKMLNNSAQPRRKRRLSPLMVIGITLPVLLGLIGLGVFVVLPRLGSHAAATPNPNCTLIVPPNPLSAQGLATPYQLAATNPANGACHEANANQSAFVQADILDPATGQITTYNPLVIDQGTQPAIAPTPPQLPANAVVALWFGDNGTTLSLLKNNARNGGGPGNGRGNGGQGNGRHHHRGQNNFAPQANTAAQANTTVQGTTAAQNNTAQGTAPAQGNTAVQGSVAAPPVAPVVPTFRMQLGGNMGNGNCVNGLPGSPFGQFAYCNAPAFFQAATAAIRAGRLTVPPLGTATDGKACPTTRDFSLVDMDQSDNVQTQYLANANGQTAQFSAANQAQIPNATVLGNPSDNALLSKFVDPALGCKAWQVPNINDNNTPTATYGTDELQAAAEQQAPAALVPAGDEMVLVNNQPSLFKVDLYRRGADQVPAFTLNGASTTTYCQNLAKIALPRLQLDMNTFQNQASPDGGATANSLFTFLANRLNATFSANGLNCVGLLNIQNPVTLTTDGNGVVTAATITTTPVAANGGTTTTTGTTGTGTTATGAVTGGATINLDTNAGNAAVALNITVPNHANQQVFFNITDQANNKQLLHQAENTDGNGANNANTVINGLQGLQALPNTWVASVTDAQGNTLGSAPVTANGAMGTVTFNATATGNNGNGNGGNGTTTNNNGGNGTTGTTTNGNGGNGTTGTTTNGNGGTQQTATGGATINFDTNAGNAAVALNITVPNFANKQIFFNITDKANGKRILHQAENTDGNGANNANTVINGLQGLQALPNTWVASVTDAQGNTLGSAPVTANGAMGTVTFG